MSRTFYDPETGAGLYESTSNNIEPFPDWVDGSYDTELWWFPNGAPTLRGEMAPTLPEALAVDVPGVFTGFPPGSRLTLESVEHIIEDGAFNFTPSTVGQYRIEVYHPAYQLWERVYNAT